MLLRRLLLEERGAMCEACGNSSRRLSVHHYAYPAKKGEDVIILCRFCHGSKHDKNVLDPLIRLQLYMEYLKGVPLPKLSRRYRVSVSSATNITDGLHKVHHILFPDSLQAMRIRNGWGAE